MNDLLDLIRAATTDGATATQKQAAATACRHLAASLEAQPGQPLAPPPPASPLAALGQLDVGQVLDLVIAKLRTKLGDAAPPPTSSGFKAPALLLPRRGGP